MKKVLKQTVKILTQDHPLIDIMAKVPMSFMTDYHLPLNDTVKVTPRLCDIYDTLMKEFPCVIRPGGSAMNTIRATQHIISKSHPESAYFMGCIGNDKHGSILEDCLKSIRLPFRLLRKDTSPTGVCAVIQCGNNRCLIPRLGAACEYPDSHTIANLKLVEAAERYYGTGYFLSTNFNSILGVSQFASANGKPVYFNLAAKKWVEDHMENMRKLLPCIEGVIGNLDEARVLAKGLGCTNCDNPDSVVKMILNSQFDNPNNRRWIVITNACKPTIVGFMDQDKKIVINEIMPPLVEQSLVKTTNGAGDVFAGALLGGLIMGKDVFESVRIGQIFVRHYILQEDGNFPNTFL